MSHGVRSESMLDITILANIATDTWMEGSYYHSYISIWSPDFAPDSLVKHTNVLSIASWPPLLPTSKYQNTGQKEESTLAIRGNVKNKTNNGVEWSPVLMLSDFFRHRFSDITRLTTIVCLFYIQLAFFFFILLVFFIDLGYR